MIECGILEEKDFERIPSSGGGAATKDNVPLSKPKQPDVNDGKDWKFYDGNLNEYYNNLKKDKHTKRDPNKITS